MLKTELSDNYNGILVHIISQFAWPKMQTLRELPAEFALEMCWSSLSFDA